MMVASSTATTVVGTVRAVNDRGVKLDPYGEWFNLSKYAEGVVLPERGEHVALGLDKSGFVRSCGPADGASNGAASPAPGNGAATLPLAARPVASGDRDRTITRLAVLKAAAEFAAPRMALKSGEVLKIAESWERWVLRDGDPSTDLDEAF